MGFGLAGVPDDQLAQPWFGAQAQGDAGLVPVERT
jgi:hypothetical protein